MIFESRAMSAQELAANGMVRCCDCKRLGTADDKGARRCSAAWRPACTPERWRRCKLYDPKVKHEQSQRETEHQEKLGSQKDETRSDSSPRAVGIEAAQEILRGQVRQDRQGV